MNDFQRFSAKEIAVLALSNPSADSNSFFSNRTILTTKDSIIWACCINSFIEGRSRRRRSDSIEDEFRIVCGEPLLRMMRAQTNLDRNVGLSPYETPLARYKELFSLSQRSLSAQKLATFDAIALRLERGGYIHDPFKVKSAGIVLFVLSMMPLEFNQRTVEGEAAYLRMSALVWDAEVKRDDHERTISAKFDVIRLTEILKDGILAAANQIDRERDEEKRIAFDTK